jgi:hypothetical protein
MSSATVSTTLAAPGKGEQTALKPSQNARRQTAMGIPDVPVGGVACRAVASTA